MNVRCVYIVVSVLVSVSLFGCMNPGERARLVKDADALRQQKNKLERDLADRDATIAELHQRVRHLRAFGPNRPADLFAPVEIEIVSRSGGADYDDVPGDDGVTVYVRPKDQSGDAVKVPGKITVQLLDNTILGEPRLLGVYIFDDADRLRQAWYGKMGTNHYTLKCPFSFGVRPSRNVDVKVEFVDYLTGRTLTAMTNVSVSFPENR